MLRESTLLRSEFALLLHRIGGYGIIVVIEAGMAALALATSSRTKRIKLCCKLRLGLDEGSTVVAHWLVTSVGILGEDGES